jgi:hypothetical protein
VNRTPDFHDASGARAWPRWTDRLATCKGSNLVEGGRRTTGHEKAGTSHQPLVTYVTVVRNNDATLHRTIESVRQQTYPAVEHVILDGSSTDGTLDVIRHYSDGLEYFASEPDNGLYEALNKAIPLARGDLICVLNSDDWLEAGAAMTAVDLLDDVKTPNLILTGANARQDLTQNEEPLVLLEWYPAEVHAGSYFMCANDCHNGIYATRSAYERSGPYDTGYEIAADFKWLMACFEAGVEFVYTNDITVNYVLGGVSSDAETHGTECVRVIRERFPYLTPEEAGGLYHTFFVYPTFPSISGRPEDRFEFLRCLLTRYPEDLQLATAVAWALLTHVDRRCDDVGEQVVEHSNAVRSPIKDRVKLALQDHQTSYRVVRWLYRGVRRA